MRLLLVRHAEAGDRAAWAASDKPDSQRPLTDEGRREFRKAARGLARAVKEVDLVASSPLVRAKQTAVLVSKEYPEARTAVVEALAPDSPYPALAKALASFAKTETAALVGHEPHLSGFAGWLCGAPALRLDLKKGAACLVELDGEARRGGGTLLWSLPPKLLRKLD